MILAEAVSTSYCQSRVIVGMKHPVPMQVAPNGSTIFSTSSLNETSLVFQVALDYQVGLHVC
jgi:hypothetical protein